MIMFLRTASHARTGQMLRVASSKDVCCLILEHLRHFWYANETFQIARAASQAERFSLGATELFDISS